jgi:diguanylate cyclase (GGDEF)-like protein/PAS domain S-box-containing protein
MSLTEDYYKNLLDNLHDGMLCVDLNKKIIFWNKSAQKLTGYAEKEVLGKIAGEEIMAHLDNRGVRKNEDSCYIRQTIDEGKPHKTEFYFKHKKGHLVPVSTRISPIKDPQGRISGAGLVFSDNTSGIAAQQAIKRLEKQAMIDPLTGLANRRYIHKILDNKIDEMSRYGLKFCLLFIDIDYFKAVNDTYGQDAGDKVLKGVASSMANVIRPSDILGRWGGEEFIIIILNVEEELLFSVTEKVRIAVEKARTEYNGRQIEVTISIGAALPDPQQKNIKGDLLKRVDELMYTSKIKGRNRVSVEFDN